VAGVRGFGFDFPRRRRRHTLERAGSKGIGSLYREYVAVGGEIMDERVAQGESSDGTALPQLREFAGLEADLDDVLDEEEAAGDATRDLYLTVAGFLIATIAAYLIGRGVLRSVRGLKEGADRIGRGDLDHRI
jgi:methyl-accepting chemotaxis protein